VKIYTDLDLSQEELITVQKEHRNSTYLLLRQTLAPVFIWPCLTVYVFWSKIDNTLALIWLAIIGLIIAGRHYLVFYWYKPHQGEATDIILERGVLIFTFMAACVWGSAMWVMDFNRIPAESVFLNVIACSLITSSIGISSFWVQYFWAYAIPFLFFYAINFLIGVPDPNYILFVSAVLFGIFLKHTCYVFYNKSIENILLRHRNQSMANSLIKQKHKAEQLASSRSDFLASASHDLRQPLQAMNLFLAVLKPHLQTQISEEIFAKLENSSDDMNELLSSMLDISRLDSDTLQVDIKAINLAVVLAQLDGRFRVQAENKGLEFHLDSNSYWVASDAVLLGRVLSNLLSNAINYTQQGAVSLRCQREGESLSLIVQDSGQGVDKDQQELIFDEFYQVGNPERDRKKGLGLGLSIVKRLCALLNVSLRFESELGKGSCFTLALPLAEQTTTTNAELISPSFNNLNDYQVLIIEDEQSVRDSLYTLLTQWGCRVIAAESTEHALSQLDPKSSIDLIISDLRLRDNRTGIEAIAEVQQYMTGEIIPSLIISGDTAPERLKQVADSGHTLLHKPVKPMQLRAAVQRLLAK